LKAKPSAGFGLSLNSVAEQEIDEISSEILSEIEKSSSRQLADSEEIQKILHLTDVRHAKKLLQHMENASTNKERDVGKKAVIRALLLSTWLQRLYFVIRSFIMGILSAALTFGFIFVFGSINLFLGIVLGVFSFVFSLVVSRLLDPQIVKATKKIVEFLSRHRALRNFVLNHF
jgi:hypothetical protein